MKKIIKVAVVLSAALFMTAAMPVKADNPVPPPCAPNCAR